MGTIGGVSLANNDPAADIPAAVLALARTVVTTSARSQQTNSQLQLRDRARQGRDHHLGEPSGAQARRLHEVQKTRPSRYAIVGVFVADFGRACGLR